MLSGQATKTFSGIYPSELDRRPSKDVLGRQAKQNLTDRLVV
jgi:hypothetical protein